MGDKPFDYNAEGSDESDAFFERMWTTDFSETPEELVHSYFSQEELEYIDSTIDEILKTYDTLGWDYKPERPLLFNFIAGSVFNLRTNTNVAHSACWRVQVQLSEWHSLGFEVLLMLGSDEYEVDPDEIDLE